MVCVVNEQFEEQRGRITFCALRPHSALRHENPIIINNFLPQATGSDLNFCSTTDDVVFADEKLPSALPSAVSLPFSCDIGKTALYSRGQMKCENESRNQNTQNGKILFAEVK